MICAWCRQGEEKAELAEQKLRRKLAKKERQREAKEAQRIEEAASAAAAEAARPKSTWVMPVCTLPSALRSPGQKNVPKKRLRWEVSGRFYRMSWVHHRNSAESVAQ